ncbi:iron ABC transporter permease [Bacillus cereus group sp. N21]|uniref:FecCD family ABC transporter permease n=1 Tax=Bacillus cereus group sp. N21 TaxID=2794591 RepID=UPI0018F58821|nr:iron ABC transporter permease [Bacillus cereus group sp. N21]MBJ8027028.1 iron ABC transporter permease [Bacillus cereus group sp. N21]
MLLKTNQAKWVGLFVGIIAVITCIWGSIIFGYTNTSWKLALDAFFHFNGSNEHIIIQNVRLPRALIAASVGASLAIAGCFMQTLTKNPLAAPDFIGLNSGAAFFIVVAIVVFSISSLSAFTWIAFFGAAVAAALVFASSSLGKEGTTPLKLTLAGVAISALFSSLTQGLLVLNEQALEEVLFWQAGSVQGRKLEVLQSVFPYLLVGWIASLMMAGKVNTLMMGEDVAKGLGQRTVMMKAFVLLIIVLLSGGSVAVAGPIGFVGIIIPHFAKALVGVDHRWRVPYSGLLGAILLLLADIAARYVIMPQEVPVGVMTAFIGAPFFIYIARKRGLSK